MSKDKFEHDLELLKTKCIELFCLHALNVDLAKEGWGKHKTPFTSYKPSNASKVIDILGSIMVTFGELDLMVTSPEMSDNREARLNVLKEYMSNKIDSIFSKPELDLAQVITLKKKG